MTDDREQLAAQVRAMAKLVNGCYAAGHEDRVRSEAQAATEDPAHCGLCAGPIAYCRCGPVELRREIERLRRIIVHLLVIDGGKRP